MVYFLLRALGKLAGCHLGSRLAAAPVNIIRYMGFALIPQAGVAIGLIFLIRGDAVLGPYASTIIPVVLGSVVLSELTGPVFARIVVEKAGEASVSSGVDRPFGPAILPEGLHPVEMDEVELIPWHWRPLEPAENLYGQVIFGFSDSKTGPALARFATLLAHYYLAKPTGVRVLPSQNENGDETTRKQYRELTQKIAGEIESLGYRSHVRKVIHENVAKGILSAANSQKTWAIILGHPHTSTSQAFNRIVDAVAKDAPCPVIMVRLSGVLHTENILVPVVDFENLKLLETRHPCPLRRGGAHDYPTVHRALGRSLMRNSKRRRSCLRTGCKRKNLIPHVRCRAIATDARTEAIVQEAQDHDVTVMAASQNQGLKRLFFGSLAEDVAQNSGSPCSSFHGVKG